MFRSIKHLQTPLLLMMVMLSVAACNLGTPQTTPVPTPDIPTVEILAPPNNAQVIAGTDFDIDILGTDASQGISKIELYVDEVLINESPIADPPQPRYRVTMNWLAQSEGLHVITVIAYRADDTRSDETILNIEVIPRN